MATTSTPSASYPDSGNLLTDMRLARIRSDMKLISDADESGLTQFCSASIFDFDTWQVESGEIDETFGIYVSVDAQIIDIDHHGDIVQQYLDGLDEIASRCQAVAKAVGLALHGRNV